MKRNSLLNVSATTHTLNLQNLVAGQIAFALYPPQAKFWTAKL